MCSKAGRQADPTAGVLDSQSIKTTEAGGERGWAGNKKIKGRRRHIVVAPMGYWRGVLVLLTPALKTKSAPALGGGSPIR